MLILIGQMPPSQHVSWLSLDPACSLHHQDIWLRINAHPIVKTLWEKDLGEGKPFKEYNPSKGALLPALMSSIAALDLPCLVQALTMS